MINPEELRIGNLVKCEGKIRSVDQIGNGLISLIPIEGITFDVCQDSELYPIPLTHELLLKIGADYEDHRPFDKSYDFESYYFEAKQLYNVHIHYSHNKKMFYYPKYDVAPMKYLHQLQNLFHALTGEELEIKL